MKHILLTLAILMVAIVSLSAQLIVSMPNTPAETTIWPGTTSVPLVSFNLTNSNATDAIYLSEMEFSFSGAFDNDTLANGRLFLSTGNTMNQISESSNDLISGDGFNEISLTIWPGQTEKLTLVVDFPSNNSGRRISAGIFNASQITAVSSSGAAMVVSGNFPMFGTLFLMLPSTISLYSAGPSSAIVHMTEQSVELYQCLIEPAGTGIILQQVTITHYGISGPDCASNLALYLNGDLISNSFGFNPATEEATFLIDDIILPYGISQLSVMGVLNPNLNWDNSICLGIEDGDVQAVSPKGVICSMEYLSASDFPILGTTWWINSAANQNQPMHRMDIYPYRNPSESIGLDYPARRYVLDTLYVYPGQSIYYYGAMNHNGNSLPNSVVAMDSYVSITDNFNQLVPDSFHYWQSWNLDDTGLLYTQDFQMSWVSNSYEGINNCGLFTTMIYNHMDPGQCGHIFTSLAITNNTPSGLVEESCFDYKTVISNIGIIGDIDGSGDVTDNDPLIGVGQWINQELFSTCFNPSDSINIMRQVSVSPHPSTANIWALNGFVHNPNDPFFSSFGFGQPYQTQANYTIPDYTNIDGMISVNTTDNFVSVFWKNADGTFGGQDIMSMAGRALKWTTETGINPISVPLERAQIQLPAGAELLSIYTKQLNYLPTSADDPVTPATTPALHGNFPNPFNPETTISFDLPKAGEVSLCIYNVKGQLVKTLVSGQESAGNHQVTWNGMDDNNRPVSSGLYYYKMTAGKYSSTKKMIMMK